MRFRPNPVLLPAVAVVLLAAAFFSGAAARLAAQSALQGLRFRAVTNLDNDAIRLLPSRKVLNLLATLECRELERLQLISEGQKKWVADLSGQPAKHYPPAMVFRFTIGSFDKSAEKIPYEMQTSLTPQEFASKLKFRLRIFHGLEELTLYPATQRIIGVPPHMPYDERIYRVEFQLKDVPVEDRMLFEVLDPDGKRVTKFGVQLL